MTNTLSGAPSEALATLQEHWPELPWGTLRETHGAFHQVLLLPPAAALRIRTGAGHAAATRREHDIAAILSGAGLRVPRPLAEPLHAEQWSAAAFSFAEGVSRDAGSWAEDRAVVLPLLEVWAAAGDEHRALATRLPAARHWCGGERWPSLVAQMTAADPEVQAAARNRVRSVLELEPTAEFSAVHGDFGPHNLLWGRDGALSLIDTDHAAWADPAIDVAPLLGFYSLDALAADLPARLLDRASAHRRTLSIQVAAAAQLRGDLQLRDHALANFARRIRSGDPQW